MSNLVFMLPFDVQRTAPSREPADTEQLQQSGPAEELQRQLELTPTRVDDWDLQMGFRLVGDTGAIRLFKRTAEGEGAYPEYALFGTAVSWEDRKKVSGWYQRCRGAVEGIHARIDNERLIDPQMAGRLDDRG